MDGMFLHHSQWGQNVVLPGSLAQRFCVDHSSSEGRTGVKHASGQCGRRDADLVGQNGAESSRQHRAQLES